MPEFKWSDDLREARRALVTEQRAQLKALNKAEGLVRKTIAELSEVVAAAPLEAPPVDDGLSIRVLQDLRRLIEAEGGRIKPEADRASVLQGEYDELAGRQHVLERQVVELDRHMAEVEASSPIRRRFIKAASSDGTIQFPTKLPLCQELRDSIARRRDSHRDAAASKVIELHAAEAAQELLDSLGAARKSIIAATDALSEAVGGDDSGPFLAQLAIEERAVEDLLERLRQRKPDEEIQALILRAQARRAKQAVAREKAQRKRDAGNLSAKKRLVARLTKEVTALEEVTKGSDRRLAKLQERIDSATATIERKTDQLIVKRRTKEGWSDPLPRYDPTLAGLRADILANSVRYPAIDNLLAKREDLSKQHRELVAQVKELKSLRPQLEKAEKELAKLSAATRGGTPPPRKVVLEWSQAEALARDYLAWLGFADARVTQQGADGGVDVVSQKAVAQVKMHNKGTGRPDVQQLYGIAAAERKTAVFFAFSYTADALAWARTHGVPLFRFARSGEVAPATPAARALMSGPPGGK